MDLATYLQGKWQGLGDDMRRKAGQSNVENMRESLPMLMMGLNAIGSRGGAVRGNNSVIANRLHNAEIARTAQTGVHDPGITGGMLQFRSGEFPSPHSTEGLLMRHHESILPATQGRDIAPYYPARQDVPRAHNENLPGYGSLQAALRGPGREVILARIRAGVAANNRRDFNIIPGGKKD